MARTRCVFERAQVRSRVGMSVCTCVCHHHSPVDSYLCVYVYVAILQLHKAVILLLIMKYFVLKNSIVFPYNYTMQPSQQPTQRKSLTGHAHYLRHQLNRLMRGRML